MIAIALLVALAPTSQKPLVDVSFEMVGNRIYLPAKLNGTPISAIFDTGAGASAADLALADQLKIPGNGRVQAGGVGAAQVTGRILEGASVEVGDQKHTVLYAIPFASMNAVEGRKLELILGHDFINQYLIQVDYAGKRMKIYPPGTNLPDLGTSIPIRLINGHPHIRTKVTIGGESHDVETMIDSGASGSGLTGRFAKAWPIPATVKTTPSTVIGGGVGGFVTGRFLRVDTLDIGGIKVNQSVASLNEGKGGANGENAAYDYLLGAEVLKRFTFTVDYANKRVFFKPNTDFAKPFEADKTGIRLTSGGPNLRDFSVVGVLPGSSGDLAGLKAGDKIVAINRIGAASKTLQEWRDYLRESGEMVYEIAIRRNGQVLTINVEAKSVI